MDTTGKNITKIPTSDIQKNLGITSETWVKFTSSGTFRLNSSDTSKMLLVF